ncbi:metalloregulator ArsR/SmtB family transcription factor [Erythrobacter sp. T5W1-R]|uniref:ArsR/SmtB family transcription factor n=1 Tax=Erythrobacter sp. T5W1-R TaxID=3101752 RepID=UPI002AFE1593|nr:metalloregulator ArsR/SmtB family transcription factor [Erythrobacter sp. T5W1-R]MEA1617900.1 metalloregulator ArsR/SmtB family transcription factor [Erythrobacter sp. T5W1-R]
MRDAKTEEALVEQFKAVAHPLRLRILTALGQSELNVGEIEQATGIGQPALSQQLSVLRKAGLVETRKEAKLVFYRLMIAELAALSNVLTGLLPGQAAVPSAAPAAPRPSPPGAAHFARLS